MVVLSKNKKIKKNMVGTLIRVHDGQKIISVAITQAIVGHFLGSFAPTRRKNNQVVRRLC